MLVAGAGLLSGCAKLAVKSADEAADVARKGADDAGKYGDDAAAAGRGDDAASKADDANDATKRDDEEDTLSDRLNREVRKQRRREAREKLEEALRETPVPTSRYDPYETSFRDDVTVDSGRFVYWELPFRTWGTAVDQPSETVSIRYTTSTESFSTSVDVFLFEDRWFDEYSQGRESRYVTAGSVSAENGLPASVDTFVPAENYVLVVDNTSVGEAPGTTSVDVSLTFSSSRLL